MTPWGAGTPQTPPGEIEDVFAPGPEVTHHEVTAKARREKPEPHGKNPLPEMDQLEFIAPHPDRKPAGPLAKRPRPEKPAPPPPAPPPPETKPRFIAERPAAPAAPREIGSIPQGHFEAPSTKRHFPVLRASEKRRSPLLGFFAAKKGKKRRQARSAPAHGHLVHRTRVDERYTRRIALIAVAIVLPSLVLGWRYLVPDDRQMLDRLIADGRLKEAAALADQMAKNSPGSGPDYGLMATTMLVESAVGAPAPARRAAFAHMLEFAKARPDDTRLASAAVDAMRRLDSDEGATDFFLGAAPSMSPQAVALWVEGLTAQHLSRNEPVLALKVAVAGWDSASDRAITPENLLRIARLAGSPGAIESRIEKFVLENGRFDKANLYREVFRETGREGVAIHALWPFLMMKSKPADYPALAAGITGAGAGTLAKETDDLLDRAYAAGPMPVAAELKFIRLALAHGREPAANKFVDRLLGAGCADTEFLRVAIDCKTWTNRPAEALALLRKCFDASGDTRDFKRGFALSLALQSSADLVAFCERRGEERLDPEERIAYAVALTGMGEYDTALRQYESLSRAGDHTVPTVKNIARLRRALGLNEGALAAYRELVALEPADKTWRDKEFQLLLLLGRQADALAAAERDWHDLDDTKYLDEAFVTADSLEDTASKTRLALAYEKVAGRADLQQLLDACSHLQSVKEEPARIRILKQLAARFPARTDIARELLLDDYNAGRFTLVERRFALNPELAADRTGFAMRLDTRIALDDLAGVGAMLADSLEKHPDWADHYDFARVASYAAILIKDIGSAETLIARLVDRGDAEDNKFRVLATRLLVMRGRAVEAIGLYSEMADTLSGELRVDYAQALASAGRFEEAETQMELAIAETPAPSPRLIAALGDLRLSAGSIDKARAAYRDAILALGRKP